MKRSILIVGGVIVLLLAGMWFYLNARRAQPSKPTNTTDVVITLERTQCFGTCPSYTLTIYGDGRLVYEGRVYVRVTGTQTAQISQDDIRAIVDEFYKIGYFSLNDSYTAAITDLQTTTTSITINGTTKRVIDYYGAPQALRELENKIDEIADTKRWVD